MDLVRDQGEKMDAREKLQRFQRLVIKNSDVF